MNRQSRREFLTDVGKGMVVASVGAGLANDLGFSTAFGGEDYVGFHTMMAIAPAYHMAGELPAPRRALPVLKVLHRNAQRIQEHGGTRNEVLRPVAAAQLPGNRPGSEVLRDAVRRPS